MHTREIITHVYTTFTRRYLRSLATGSELRAVIRKTSRSSRREIALARVAPNVELRFDRNFCDFGRTAGYLRRVILKRKLFVCKTAAFKRNEFSRCCFAYRTYTCPITSALVRETASNSGQHLRKTGRSRVKNARLSQYVLKQMGYLVDTFVCNTNTVVALYEG